MLFIVLDQGKKCPWSRGIQEKCRRNFGLYGY